MKTKITLGSDHGGLELKNYIKEYLNNSRLDQYEIQDLGTFSDESVDYPDYAEKVVNAILSDNAQLGILFCGTGIGLSMKANRYKGIRAALVHDEYTAKMAKAHNNANILCLGGRITKPELADKLVDIWLDTSFEGARHQRRLDKLDN